MVSHGDVLPGIPDGVEVDSVEFGNCVSAAAVVKFWYGAVAEAETGWSIPVPTDNVVTMPLATATVKLPAFAEVAVDSCEEFVKADGCAVLVGPVPVPLKAGDEVKFGIWNGEELARDSQVAASVAVKVNGLDDVAPLCIPVEDAGRLKLVISNDVIAEDMG